MGIGNHEKPNKGKTDVWLTPLEIVRSLGEFDLDPCGQEDHATAAYIYPDKGLDRQWFGRVWLNPPYSEIDLWVDKWIEHGRGVGLFFARMDTAWCHRLYRVCSSMAFPRKRITFLQSDKTKPRGNAGAPSMFVALGETPDWDKLPMEVWRIK